MRSNVISSQGVHDRFGGVVPEIASRHHLELINASSTTRCARPASTLDDVDAGRGHRRARGSSARCSSASRRAKALAAARGLPLIAGRPPPGPRRGELPAAPDPFEPPFLCLIASGGHTLPGARRRTARGFEVLGRDARRRRRRGVRQGRAHARPAVPRRARTSSAWPRDGDPRRLRLPASPRGVAGPRLLASPGSRPRCSTRCATSARTRRERRRADLAASYQQAIVDALRAARRARAASRPGLDRARDRRRRRGQRAAARAAGRARRATLHVPPPRAVHRQRGDDRARRALDGEPLDHAGALALDAYATGRARPVTARVTVYVRPGCHLCDEALDDAARAAARARLRAARTSTSRPTTRCTPATSSGSR